MQLINLTPNGQASVPTAASPWAIDPSAPSATNSTDLAPGGYLARITSVFHESDKQRFVLTFDIATGDHAGHFAQTPIPLDWTHALYESYAPDRMAYTRRDVGCIAKSNPAADVYSIWNSDPAGLKGLLVAVVLSYRESVDCYGEDELMPSWRVITTEALSKGAYKIPGLLRKDKTHEPATQGAPVSIDLDGDDDGVK